MTRLIYLSYLFFHLYKLSPILCGKYRSRKDLFKYVTPDYYGYRDDDDGLLAPLEAAREVSKIIELSSFIL